MLDGESKIGSQGVNLPFSFPDALSCILVSVAQIDKDAHDECFAHIVQIARPLVYTEFELFEGVGVAIQHNKFSLHIEQSF